jgi:predicted DNA-binding transcriptional regulator AlpA
MQPDATTLTGTTTGLARLLVGHARAAAMCGIGLSTWHRLNAAGQIGPTPIKLGGRVLWPVGDLTAWVAAGCPDRSTWNARKAAQTNGRA